ncbi:MAG TPA: NAD-dependent epimerase/dehydratase family protein [Candidatus Limnocylindrales bacterium]|nr:NAD-dependent epimerase/dehydratase family protein [Candidatus Limnocylindrales bacterium]
MRVLVTGGLGFVGRAVVTELERHDHQVLTLTHSAGAAPIDQATVIKADLRAAAELTDALKPLGIEGVCHLAALTSVRDSIAHPMDYYDTNLSGTLHLLRAVPEGIPVIMTSTSAVYGSARPGGLGEDAPQNPENPYAASKLAAEQLLAFTSAAGSIGSVVLRCFNIAGAVNHHGDPDASRIIPAALRAAAGQIPHVTVNGDGTAVREFTHVLDIASGVRLALEAAQLGEHHTFNIGTGEGHQIIEIIRLARTVTGRHIEVVHRPAATEAHTLISNPQKIRDSLGWRPTRSGIRQIIEDAWAAKLSSP